MKNWEWAHEQLWRLQSALVALEQLEEEKEELVRIASGMKSVAQGVEMTPSDGNPAEARMVKYLKVTERIDRKIALYVEQKERIIEEINSLDCKDASKYSRILYKRYVEGKGMRAIAREMHYSREYLSRQHKRALVAYYDKYLARSQEFTFT